MTTIDTPQTANFAMTGQSVPLDQLPLGSRCRIEAIDEDSESLLRLMEMGLVPGAIATIEHSAPFKSPYSLRLQAAPWPCAARTPVACVLPCCPIPVPGPRPGRDVAFSNPRCRDA